MTIFYLTHGFNVKDNGAGTVDRLAKYIPAQYEIKQVDYNWSFLARVRLCNKSEARMLAGLVEPDSIGIGHSNGCALLHLAAQYGAPFKELIYINPALDKKAKLSPQVKNLHVWHSPSDVPVKLSSYLVGHVWGRMGATGYQGPEDMRIINYDKENDYYESSSSHSDVFEPEKLDYFGPIIIDQLRTI